jgi:putative hydrolase
MGDLEVSGAEGKLLAWEGGLFVGLVARVVLAQFDPFRDQLIVVYPNLGDMARGSGLRWLMFHEVTHLAQFRAAPWIPDRIVELGREVISGQQPGWTREALGKLPEVLPELIRWARGAVEGRDQTTPLLELLPDAQREAVFKLHAMVTVLEGHATLITDLIGRRVLADFDALKARIEARKKRPPLIRLLEAVAGLEMKRQQYVLGRAFCEKVWEHGGASALEAAWRGPESMPTLEELREPELWLARVGTPMAT